MTRIWSGFSRPDGPAHFTYRGLDGLRRGNDSLREVWAEISGEILEITGSSDRVVSVIRWRLRGQSGVELEAVEGWATWLRDGRISRIEQHGTKQKALQATGLSE